MLAEADENDDGVLEYKEFLPAMITIINGLKARHAARASRDAAADMAREEAQYVLLRGMPASDLEALMVNVFEAADEDKSGSLSRPEFKTALKSGKLGLSSKEINLLLSEVDVNGDGMVSYKEFVPLCFEILVEKFKTDLMEDAAFDSEDALTQARFFVFGGSAARVQFIYEPQISHLA